jgi:hypothetical protein
MGADLTATAEGNSHARCAAAREKLEADTSRSLASFRDFVEKSAFATNVRLEKVVAYEEAGGIIDGRAYCILCSAGDTVAGLERFASSQNRYFLGRENFEDLWEHGRRFVYGAVNAGGMGVEEFGPICLVVADVEAEVPDALGVFPEDTVKRYTDAGSGVDEGRALSEVTMWDDRSDLAVVERANEAVTAAQAGWPPLLCSDDGYLEVVVTGPLPLKAIAEARLPDALRARLDELRAKYLLEEPMTMVEQGEAHAYDVLHRWRHRHGTAIDRVTSA